MNDRGAKAAAGQVRRAQKRRTIRAELAARCGVFNETDHGTSENAPEGWVEIQHFDTIDREFGSKSAQPFESDEHAALAVAEIGGALGTAMHYETISGILEPVSLDGLGTSHERWMVLRSMAALQNGNDGHWICIVPRSVAIAAGLIEK